MELKIIKIGGQVINEHERLVSFLSAFAKLEGPKILVHGGGRKATELSKKLGIPTTMIAGRRVTDAATLDVATMVYAGLVNKNITALLQKMGTQALGLSGADLNSIQSHKRTNHEVDYGFVGDIDIVNGSMINQLLQLGIVPVFCALTHDKKGQLLNTNADTIASNLSIALGSFFDTELFYCFEKEGVLADPDDDDSVIKELTSDLYLQYKTEGIISAGMIAKLDNAFLALRQSVSRVIICSAEAVIENEFQKATHLCL